MLTLTPHYAGGRSADIRHTCHCYAIDTPHIISRLLRRYWYAHMSFIRQRAPATRLAIQATHTVGLLQPLFVVYSHTYRPYSLPLSLLLILRRYTYLQDADYHTYCHAYIFIGYYAAISYIGLPHIYAVVLATTHAYTYATIRWHNDFITTPRLLRLRCIHEPYAILLRHYTTPYMAILLHTPWPYASRCCCWYADAMPYHYCRHWWDVMPYAVCITPPAATLRLRHTRCHTHAAHYGHLATDGQRCWRYCLRHATHTAAIDDMIRHYAVITPLRWLRQHTPYCCCCRIADTPCHTPHVYDTITPCYCRHAAGIHTLHCRDATPPAPTVYTCCRCAIYAAPLLFMPCAPLLLITPWYCCHYYAIFSAATLTMMPLRHWAMPPLPDAIITPLALHTRQASLFAMKLHMIFS